MHKRTRHANDILFIYKNKQEIIISDERCDTLDSGVENSQVVNIFLLKTEMYTRSQ